MANITPANNPHLVDNQMWTWTPITENDTAIATQFQGSGDRCFSVTGNFGAGGTVLLEGSNDDTNYFGLKDASGTAISLTAAGIRQVLEGPKYIRPRVSAGTGVSVTAILFVRR